MSKWFKNVSSLTGKILLLLRKGSTSAFSENLIKQNRYLLLMVKRALLGLTERIFILGADKEEKVTARIDTGATGSSIDLHLAADLHLALLTKTKIVKSATGVRKRVAIRAKIKIAGQIIEDEFTLAERRHMTYPVLIGQNILKKGKFLIDPLREGYS